MVSASGGPGSTICGAMTIGRHPSVLTAAELRWLCGVTPETFADLACRVGPVWEHERTVRLSARKRQRALGAGRPYRLVFASRLFVTLLHLRHNVPFRALGAIVGTGKDTAHRATAELVPLLAEVGFTTSDGDTISSVAELKEFFERRGPGKGVLLDGTFIPTPRPGGGWDEQKAQYPGHRHRHRHCRNTQVCTDMEGRVLWVSEPAAGPTHDITGARNSGIGEAAAATGTVIVADRGYQGWGNQPTDPDGLEVFAPHKGRPRGEGTYNGFHASIRVRSEHGIRTLKRFKVLHDFRRHADHLHDTLKAVGALATTRLATA